jgi:predicted metal-dependent enzyme (double-stranded beta helix superfamily)
LININGNHRSSETITALPLEELVRIAVSIAAAAPEDLLPPGPGRRWAKAVEVDSYEAWVIAWPPGAGLPMHHHRGAAGALEVVRGRLHEQHLAEGTAVARVLAAGRVVAMPADHVHQIDNVDAVEAVSVHVYSPPGGEPEFI